MGEYKEGLYDRLITRRLREYLDNLAGPNTKITSLEESDAPHYLSRHLVREIKSILATLPSDERLRRQIEFANTLLRQAEQLSDSDDEPDVVESPGEILKAIYRGPSSPSPPSTPLSASSLLMNAQGEARLGFELERELATSDSVLMLVSFVQWRGWQRLKRAFYELAERGAPVRLLTTTYMGATDLGAIRELAKLPNVRVRISLDGRRRRLHAKAWLFHRHSGYSSAYVGSANLSGPALEDGIEWTVKLSEVEAPHIVERFRGAFESLWNDPEFEDFLPNDEGCCQRVRMALESAQQKGGSTSARPVFFDLRPHPYQQATLDRLEAERLDRNSFRNLVVAPTGTGKTLVAAFDYARQKYSGARPRLLYLAHREELLRQGRDRFRHVLRDESFGELLAGGERPTDYDHLFATVQSLRSRALIEKQGADYWHYVVLDEAHHVPADSYRDTIASLQPRILLGLTATPERMDGASILPWFNHRIADEMRLWNAIERQYLAPFDYYGIHDGTDLSTVSWSRGSYVVSELEQQYLANSRRANLVLSQFCEAYGANWHQARAIGFCVSIAHANFMAKVFQAAGIPSAAITSESSYEERSGAIGSLRDRQFNVLFTVDLFNEGVDVPEADCVLFLRPTESATVFLQQLGRGLRLDTGKTSCLVLDFIGTQRREFRFDFRFRALFGGTRRQIAQEIESGVTQLPGNCYFRLDKEARKAVLDNLRSQLQVSRARMIQEVIGLASRFGRRPTLTEFLREAGYDLQDVYKKSAGGWYSLLLGAQLVPGTSTADDQDLISRFRFLLHLDSPRRLLFYRNLLQKGSSADLGDIPLLDLRMLEMLTHRIFRHSAGRGASSWDAAFHALKVSEMPRREFEELCDALLDRIGFHTSEEPFAPDWPLFLHRQYTRDEILVAIGKAELVGKRHTQVGRIWFEEMNAEILFVTLAKTERSFSPTTRYEDFAVSPTQFHWQSQSTTREDSPTGQRYVRQPENRVNFLLFVRPTTDDPFVFLGAVRYLNHTGSRPMSIYWELEKPMPAWFFETCASLRVA